MLGICWHDWQRIAVDVTKDEHNRFEWMDFHESYVYGRSFVSKHPDRVCLKCHKIERHFSERIRKVLRESKEEDVMIKERRKRAKEIVGSR